MLYGIVLNHCRDYANVLRKALEGLTKNVPPPSVQSVFHRMRTHTEQTGTLVRAGTEQPTEMGETDSERTT